MDRPELTLLALPDDVLVRIAQLLAPGQELLGVCGRLRALCHANATAVKLTRGYEGRPADDAHVAILAACPALARLDASDVQHSCWPLAALTRLTALTVPALWSPENMPPGVRALCIPHANNYGASNSWPGVLSLASAEGVTECVITRAFLDSDDGTLLALAQPGPAARVRLLELALAGRVPPAFAALAASVLSRLRAVELFRLPDADLAASSAVSLPTLTSLSLQYCTSLRRLAGLDFPRLGALRRVSLSGCTALTTLADLSGLGGLRELHLRRCKGLAALGVAAPGLSSLTSLVAVDCTALRTLDWCEERGRTTLRHLDVSTPTTHLNVRQQVASTPRLASLSAAVGNVFQLYMLEQAAPPSLARLTLLLRDQLPSTATFGRLARPLRALHLHGVTAPSFADCAGALTQLTALSVVACEQLTSLDGLQRACELATLEVQGCPALATLDGLEEAATLGSVAVSACAGLSRVAALTDARALTALRLADCPALPALDGVGSPRLERLMLNGSAWAGFRGLGGGERLRFLSVWSHSALVSLDGLSGASQLTALLLQSCPRLTSLEGLSAAARLRELHVTDCVALAGVAELRAADLSLLTKLDLVRNGRLASLEGLAGATRLRRLDLRRCAALTSLAGLAPGVAAALADLKVDGCEALQGAAPGVAA